MKEFRKYEYGGDVDYVLFCGKSLDEILVSAVSLQNGEWYTFEAVWEMDFLPETAEEYASVLWSHNNDTKGCSCGSWKNANEISNGAKNKAHDEIIKHFGLDKLDIGRVWFVIEKDGFYRVFYKTDSMKECLYNADDLPETVKKFITESEIKDGKPDKCGYCGYWGRFDD